MTSSRYDILQKLLDGDPLWVETAATMEVSGETHSGIGFHKTSSIALCFDSDKDSRIDIPLRVASLMVLCHIRVPRGTESVHTPFPWLTELDISSELTHSFVGLCHNF